MQFKLLKKLVGLFGYKIISKDFIKNNRLLDNNEFISLNEILNFLFENKNINSLIQIGANDGLRFDYINKYIKKYLPKTVLVEPVKDYFEDLKKNYKDFNNIIFENLAISVGNQIKYLYKVDKSKIDKYDEHIFGINSFDIKHLKSHGVKSSHIVKEKVQTENISNLINKYFTSLDLLLIDAEGYDGFILNDLFMNSNFRPIIISEYVHINHDVFKKLIVLLDNNDYFYFQLKENIICFPKEKKPIIKLFNQ
mgnify:FL=1